MSKETVDFSQSWAKPSIRIGRVAYLAMIACSFAPCIYLYLAYGAKPGFDIALSAWGSVAMTFGAFYFVEPFSYFPILGLTGTYMGVISGNISNVRLPASATAQDALGVENGTQEAEIVSTLGIAGSIFTNLFFLTLAVIIGSWVLTVLPETILMALKDFVLPAIFGAMFAQFAVAKPKIAIYAAAVSIFMLTVFKGLPQYVYIIIAIFGNLAITRVLYKKGLIK